MASFGAAYQDPVTQFMFEGPVRVRIYRAQEPFSEVIIVAE
jgi:hypothetical protein